MIKNERQFKLTRSQLERFRAALEETSHKPDDGWLDLELCTIRSQIAEFEHDLADYEGLRNGTVEVGGAASLDDLPRLLIRKRIAEGLTQRDLAEKLGMKEQQVQRYEADDWATANLRRLTEVAQVVALSLSAVPAVTSAGSGVAADDERPSTSRRA